MLVMLSHGLVSGALFLCVGVIYDRLHTREIGRYGGVATNMPHYALLFLLFTMASVGLPGTSGFVGEFLSMMGIYQASSWAAFVATTGIVWARPICFTSIAAWLQGPLDKPDAVAAMPDLSLRELLLLVPIAAVVLWMGIYPESFVAPIRKDIGMMSWPAPSRSRMDRAAKPSAPADGPGLLQPENASADAGHEGARMMPIGRCTHSGAVELILSVGSQAWFLLLVAAGPATGRPARSAWARGGDAGGMAARRALLWSRQGP